MAQAVKEKMVELEYIDGKKAKIDLKYVMQYEGAGTSEINPYKRFCGTGCSLDYIIDSIQKGKPILVSKRLGGANEEAIDKIFNTKLVREAIPDFHD